MTEIQAGNSFTASTRLLQEMHKAAEDGVVEAKELARLAQIALDDSSGLTEDEQKMLSSLYSGKIDTSGLSEEEKNAITQLQNGSKGVSAEIVDKNIKSLQSLSAHESDPNQLNFSNLQLISESKSFLSRASFGLFGGTTQTSHVVRISDGNIPAVHNPSETTTMAERQDIDRQNLVNMLGPLEQELAEGMAENSDLRQRFAEFLGEPADSQAVTKKIQELADKIKEFKTDPNKKGWTTSDDLTALMNSYANKPAEGNPRMTSGYMNAMLGAFWNATDSRNMARNEQQNIASGNIQTPPSVDELNTKLSEANNMSKNQLESTLAKTSAFIDQLDALKQSDPEAYQHVLRGTDESGIDVLRAQVSELKQHLSTGEPIGQTQMNQLNTMWASMQQMEKSLNLSPDTATTAPAKTDVQLAADQQITVFKEMLADPMMPAEVKAQIEAQIKVLETQSQQLAEPQSSLSPESQAAIEALRVSHSEAYDSVFSGHSGAKEAVATRSGMVAELKYAESTLSQLLTQNGISEAGKEKLQSQLDATRSVLGQLQAGQEINLTEPGQAAAFQQVLQGLQGLKPPTPVVTNPLPELDPTTEALIADADNLANDLELVALPGPYNPVSNSSLFNPEPLSLNYSASNFSLLDFDMSFGNSFSSYGTSSNLLYGNSFSNDPLGICSPSFGYGGLSSGTGGYNFWQPQTPFPAYFPPTLAPSSENSSEPSATPTSLSNIFLEGVGEDPSQVTPAGLSPEVKAQQEKALSVIDKINADGDASQDAKNAAAILSEIIKNPNQPIPMPPPNGPLKPVPPGSFEAASSVLDTYSSLKQKNISTKDAQTVFMLAAQLAAQGIQEGISPAEIANEVAGIANGSKKEIEDKLLNLRTLQIADGLNKAKEFASGLENTNQFNTLAVDLLGNKLVDQARTLPGGENISSTQEAFDFLKQQPELKPSLEAQLLIHPEFQTRQTALQTSAQKQIKELNVKSANLVQQTRNLEVTGANRINSVDEAITFLSRIPNKTDAQSTLLSNLQSNKTESDSLLVDVKAIRQMQVASTTATKTLNGIATAKQRFSALPQTPENIAHLRALNALEKEIRETGELSDTSAGIYASYQLEQPVNAFGAVVSSDPDQTPAQRSGFRQAWEDFNAAGTPEAKDAAFARILDRMRSWNGNRPPDLERQNRMMESLGLPLLEEPLTHSQLLARLGNFVPSQVMNGMVAQFADLSTGMEIARRNFRGETDFSDLPARRAAFISSAMNTPTDPASLRAMAPDNPLAAAVVDYQDAVDERREQIGNLPPDQQAAAWGEVASEWSAAQQIFTEMNEGISASIANLSEANNEFMVAAGYPPVSGSEAGGVRPQPQYDSKTQALINEANALGDSLILAPVPSQGGEDFLNNLINDFIDIIRDLDYKTRQLVLQQLAQQMTNNAITQFYKDKVDEGNDYHQQALDRLAENFKEQIERTIESGLASQAESSQGVAAVSGQVTGAALANAIESVSARESIAQMLDITTQMNPPLSQQQQERILDAVTRIMEAGGVPSLTDAQLGLPGLSNPLLRDQVVS